MFHRSPSWEVPHPGWSELAPTNAPVEDEPIQPVLRMNILPARCVFFFSPLFCPTYLPPPIPPPTSPILPTTYLPPPTLNLPPPPTYHLRTPPPPHSITRARLVERKLELWSCCCGADAVELLLWSWSRSSSAHKTHAPTIR